MKTGEQFLGFSPMSAQYLENLAKLPRNPLESQLPDDWTKSHQDLDLPLNVSRYQRVQVGALEVAVHHEDHLLVVGQPHQWLQQHILQGWPPQR